MESKGKIAFTGFAGSDNIRAEPFDSKQAKSVNLRTLEYVVAVADLGHFSRAAERCNVSQPTLSLQIRSLESQLGVSLFKRGEHPVQLTPEGRRLIGLVRETTSVAQKIGNLAQTLRMPVRANAA